MIRVVMIYSLLPLEAPKSCGATRLSCELSSTTIVDDVKGNTGTATAFPCVFK
jgi:hypothetical protein